MDQATVQDRQAVGHGGARDPEALREEIEAIRHELGETVAALAEKTDVTRQAKARIDRATQRIEHRRDQLRDALGSPGTGPPAHSAVAETTRKPVPLGIALAAAAAGFMIGRLTGGR